MRMALAMLILVVAGPSLVLADDAAVFMCGGFHFVRSNGIGGLEIGTSSFAVRNLDTANPVSWRRLTIRNLFGDVVHDSGSAVGTPLPLNFDVPGGLDVSIVPPGASYYLNTNNIWGNAAIPGRPGQGNAVMALVEVAAEHVKLVEVTLSLRERELLRFDGAPAFQGPAITRDGRPCVRVKPRDGRE